VKSIGDDHSELHVGCRSASIQVFEGLGTIGQKYMEVQKEKAERQQEGVEKEVEHERKTVRAWCQAEETAGKICSSGEVVCRGRGGGREANLEGDGDRRT